MAKDKYKDIRPYNDDEVPEVLERLVNDPELVSTVARFKFGSLAGLFKPLVKMALKKQVKGINTVRDFQDMVAGYADQMIESEYRFGS